MRAEMWPATGFASGDSADAIPLAFCLVPKAGTRTVSHRHVVPDVGPNISRPDCASLLYTLERRQVGRSAAEIRVTL